MRRLPLAYAFAVLVLAAVLQVSSRPATAAESSGDSTAADRPNIVIIYADDLGYGDLTCYGHPTIRTPNLDRMAAEGMRFTDFYSAAEVCTPSRAALLTGRLPIRSGMCSHKRRVLFPDSAGGLPLEEITIAEGLKTRGYATGMVGKWHLGHLPQYLPTRQGFDEYFGIPYSNDMDRLASAPKGRAAFLEENSAYWNVPLIEGEKTLERAPDQSQLTRRYTERAVDFIRRHRDGPFFFYFAHTFPHVPLFASKEFRGQSPRGLYGDVVEELDWSVGQVLDAIREQGIAQRTVVFFSSDNGPWLTQGDQGGSSGLLFEGKGSTWEGGMREPGLAWWPGHVPAGSINRSMASTMDLFVTSLKLAGAEVPQDRVIDGTDLRGTLLSGEPSPRNVFFYYRGPDLYAVRKGPYKAHLITQPAYGTEKPQKHDPPLLFHLGVDPGEKYNVAKDHPEVLRDIAQEIERHRTTVEPVENQLEQ
ncbi:MAG: sulfatase [Planctomycetota bacterium]